ncbi:MAG: formate dehydrogenase accessory sulfurtransferase FdhD, partial [Candidatus Tectomicrobia bacterium]|nr:formate dehydrogenase accessory sulfurtransferase FdhD [Candidatus Tectomicrobia bacterium]
MGFYQFRGENREWTDREVVGERPLTINVNGKELVRFLCTPEKLTYLVERPLTINVNGKELVRFLCTPEKLTYLVVGFLYYEGIIQGIEDLLMVRVCEEDGVADVQIEGELCLPEKKAITSGCGGGVTYNIDFSAQSLENVACEVTPEQLFDRMADLYEHAVKYKETRGIHTSALATPDALLAYAEDVGRHNTLDKLMGESLLRRFSGRAKILLSSGRISSEMLLKAAKMRVPIVVSRTS